MARPTILETICLVTGLTPTQAKARIVDVLKEHHGNIRAASGQLKVTRQTLYNFVARCGLERELERMRKAGAR